jgi:hypothetical protein
MVCGVRGECIATTRRSMCAWKRVLRLPGLSDSKLSRLPESKGTKGWGLKHHCADDCFANCGDLPRDRRSASVLPLCQTGEWAPDHVRTESGARGGVRKARGALGECATRLSHCVRGWGRV